VTALTFFITLTQSSHVVKSILKTFVSIEVHHLSTS